MPAGTPGAWRDDGVDAVYLQHGDTPHATLNLTALSVVWSAMQDIADDFAVFLSPPVSRPTC
jgi:hypothetical protein